MTDGDQHLREVRLAYERGREGVLLALVVGALSGAAVTGFIVWLLRHA